MSGNTKFRELGFTISEMIVVVALIGILIGPVIGGMFYFYGGTVANNQRASLAIDAQTILRLITDELRVSAGIRASNSIVDPNGPTGGWNTSNDDLVLIIATPVLDTDGEFVINPDTGYPYQNEYVYYAQDGDLYKRTLANTEAAGNRLITSCPPESASSGCPGDKVLSDSFKDMNFVFYDQDNVETTDLSAARSINLFISMENRIFGRAATYENNMRATLRNTLL